MFVQNKLQVNRVGSRECHEEESQLVKFFRFVHEWLFHLKSLNQRKSPERAVFMTYSLILSFLIAEFPQIC